MQRCVRRLCARTRLTHTLYKLWKATDKLCARADACHSDTSRAASRQNVQADIDAALEKINSVGLPGLKK